MRLSIHGTRILIIAMIAQSMMIRIIRSSRKLSDQHIGAPFYFGFAQHSNASLSAFRSRTALQVGSSGISMVTGYGVKGHEVVGHGPPWIMSTMKYVSMGAASSRPFEPHRLLAFGVRRRLDQPVRLGGRGSADHVVLVEQQELRIAAAAVAFGDDERRRDELVLGIDCGGFTRHDGLIRFSLLF